MEFMKILFHFNLFPKFQVEKVLINECLTNIFRPSLHFPTVLKQKIYLKLPYIGSLTSQLNRNILTIIEATFPRCQYILINYDSFSIYSFFRHKESHPVLLRFSLIYLFKCTSCNAPYVRQTGLQLKVRIDKHRVVSYRTILFALLCTLP